MNFVQMIIRMATRRLIFGSGKNLMKKWGRNSELEELESMDTSNMTKQELRKHDRKIDRIQQNAVTKSNPWMYAFAILVGLAILYFTTLKK